MTATKRRHRAHLEQPKQDQERLDAVIAGVITKFNGDPQAMAAAIILLFQLLCASLGTTKPKKVKRCSVAAFKLPILRATEGCRAIRRWVALPASAPNPDAVP